jgi:hypothetical protein
MIGLRTGAANDVASFDDIFASDILTTLAPGRVAQVTWYVVKGASKEHPGQTSLGSHAFLIGRFKDRDVWFLSDQGASPAVELEAPDLATLKQQALATKRYWTGAPPHRMLFGQPLAIPPGTTQVLLLGERGGVEKEAKTLVLGPGDPSPRSTPAR